MQKIFAPFRHVKSWAWIPELIPAVLDGRLVDGHGVEHPVPVALSLLVAVPHRAHPLALDSLLRPGVLGRGLNGDFKLTAFYLLYHSRQSSFHEQNLRCFSKSSILQSIFTHWMNVIE